MNHYLWNMLNNVNDLLFVIHAQSREIVLKNNVFDELVSGMTEEMRENISDFMPKMPGCDDPLAAVVEYLQAGNQVFCQTFQQKALDTIAQVQVSAGYFDKEKNEIYFALKGYQSIVAFIRLKKSLAKIPENIAILEQNEAFTFYCGNEEFEKTFSTPQLSFGEKYQGSFANAIPTQQRGEILAQIKQELAHKGRSSVMVELTTAAEKKHYVMVSMKPTSELLNRTVLCATFQVLDDSVKQYLKIQNEHEVYSVASHFSNSVLFRLDLANMEAHFFGDSVKEYQMDQIKENAVEEILNRKLIYPEDLPVFHALIENMKQGVAQVTKLRIQTVEGRCEWYSVEYKIICDESGTPTQALGRIINVQKNQELQEKASIDLLTGCTNKGTFEANCMNLLSEKVASSAHAFFIIDLDNFKAVNDNLGHFFGDIVLKEVATKLKRIFRTSDYIARIGGDEFAVVMKEVNKLEIVKRKAEELVQTIDITYRGEGAAYRISASVGVAIYPNDAGNYEDLYKRADIALYHAKNTGKNAYKCYDHSLEQGTMANTTPFDVANRAFSHFFDQQVAMDTFNLLFETTDSKDAIDMVLRHLGERFGVDRCYVFSATDAACTSFNNTYEWCRNGITPEMENLQNLPYELFESCFAQANEEGVFYCNDVSQLESDAARETLQMQGIISMLHTYVKKDGRYRYTLGFDDCTSKRIWNPSEISTLMYASKIIAQFLLYAEAIEHASNSMREQMAVMNNQNFHAYIVDNTTHQICYYNDLTKRVIPSIKQGDVCYQIIRGKTAECEDCPLKTLRENNAQKTRAVIYNEVLQSHFLVTASSLKSFEGKACTFVSSTDISDIVEKTSIAMGDLSEYKRFD